MVVVISCPFKCRSNVALYIAVCVFCLITTNPKALVLFGTTTIAQITYTPGGQARTNRPLIVSSSWVHPPNRERIAWALLPPSALPGGSPFESKGICSYQCGFDRKHSSGDWLFIVYFKGRGRTKCEPARYRCVGVYLTVPYPARLLTLQMYHSGGSGTRP